MAFVVTEPCVNCKYTDCVAVCPCECFREGETMLYIDPVDCIDCEACVPECPVEAIFHESAVPPQWRRYVALNAEGAGFHPRTPEKRGGCPRPAPAGGSHSLERSYGSATTRKPRKNFRCPGASWLRAAARQ